MGPLHEKHTYLWRERVCMWVCEWESVYVKACVCERVYVSESEEEIEDGQTL